ncbi:MAG: hypothetical protein ACKOSS_01390 [Planctomycetia bacterium]
MPRIVTVLALLLVAVGIVYPTLLVPSAATPAGEPAAAPGAATPATSATPGTAGTAGTTGAPAEAAPRKAASWTGYIPAILGGLMLLLGLWQSGAARWVTLFLALAGAGAATSRLLKAEKIDLGASYPQQALTLTVLLCGVIVIACLVGKRSTSPAATPPTA